MAHDSTPVRLTQYSHGAGCGCKLSPAVLSRILAGNEAVGDARLLVGNHARDDAAAYLMDGGMVMLSTTDFFMPIVDDPFDFGRIASANAISDIYAMGGRPTMALAILGWPINTLSPDIAQRVISGSRALCLEAGIALAGGHSIDSPEPIFGLAVSGLVHQDHLKRNDGAQAGDLLLLTKPLGVGILSTARKRGLLRDDDDGVAAASMLRLNRVGASLSAVEGVHAMTDVTGFGLLGHLGELCVASAVQAHVDLSHVPLLTDLDHYLDLGTLPGGTGRNWESYGHLIGEINTRTRALLCDPQTSGGLLIAVAENTLGDVQDILRAEGLDDFTHPIGRLYKHPDHAPHILVDETR